MTIYVKCRCIYTHIDIFLKDPPGLLKGRCLWGPHFSYVKFRI
jgi:hypothetical protein